VLDQAHRLALRGVAEGEAGDSPALRDLVATGLVAERAEGGYDVTSAGRAALGAGSARWERIALVVASLGLAVLVVDTVAGWLS
jgi:hypothetical protein